MKIDSTVFAVATADRSTLIAINGFDDEKNTVNGFFTGGERSARLTQSGLHLVPVVNGSASKTLNVRAYFVDTLSNLTTAPGVSIKLAAEPDPRSVQIDSPSFFDGAGKNWRNEGGQPAVNWPKADGAKTVDSVASWNGSSSRWYGGVPSDHTFNATATNFTSPTYNWTLSGDGQSTSLVPSGPRATSWNLSGLQRIQFPATPVGKISTLKVDVTDTDKVKGANSFVVRWHPPYDKAETLPNGPRLKTKIRQLVGPLAPGVGASWVDVPAENFDFGALADGVAVLSGAAGHPEVGESIEIFKAVTGLAKLFFEFGGETAPRDNAGQISTSWRNDDGQWVPITRNMPQNITGATAAELADRDGFSGFDMRIHEVKHWHKESWLCDKYTVTGYVSSDHPFSADVVTGITQEPYYTRIAPPANG